VVTLRENGLTAFFVHWSKHWHQQSNRVHLAQIRPHLCNAINELQKFIQIGKNPNPKKTIQTAEKPNPTLRKS
jgi:hypothetical protein